MKKYIVLNDIYGSSEKQITSYDYNMGEVISVNSNSKYKCVDIIYKDNCKYFIFKQGKISYNY